MPNGYMLKVWKIIKYALSFYTTIIKWIIFTTKNATIFNKLHSFFSILNNILTCYFQWCFMILFLTFQMWILSTIWMLHFKVSTIFTINTHMQTTWVPHKNLKDASQTSMVSMNTETSHCVICRKIVYRKQKRSS